MNFEKHLFISYAHIDNKPLTAGDQGWVTRFHEKLEEFLTTRLGRDAQIWRDDKLQGNDIFADEIVDQFARTAVLVSVLTPRYLNSEWCTREVAEFCNRAPQSGGVTVENKARIFKVLKTPVDTQESLPAVLKDALGYDFYALDEDETPLELDAAYGKKYGRAFLRKVQKLAFDVSKLLKQMETATDDGANETQATAKATIYLGECSYDRKEDREKLKDDLQGHGYMVLPDCRLPQEEADYVTEVQKLLEHCKLSIHLVGDNYGLVPDGPSQKSVVVLQNELAVENSRVSGLQRMVWLPEGTGSEQVQQQQFIEAMQADADVQFGADLINADFEALKTEIHATLKKLEEPAPRPAGATPGGVDGRGRIYMIFDERDRKSTVPLRKFFREQGFEVDTPVFEGDAAVVRAANHQCMVDCDAVIVFYGAGDEAWKRTVDNELKKMPGYREGKPLLANYTYLAEPKTGDKEDLINMGEPGLIDGRKDFSEQGMAEFIQALTAAGETS